MNNPQSQKEFANLIHSLKELMMGFGGLFQKNHGRNVSVLNEKEMNIMHRKVETLAQEQRDLAKEYQEKGKHAEAVYLKTRSKVMDAIADEIGPEKLAERAENPLNVSQEEFAKRFEDALARELDEYRNSDEYKAAESTIDFHLMDINAMQKLDQKLVESKFNIGNKTERTIFAGLAVGENVLRDAKASKEYEELSQAKKFGKENEIRNKDGSVQPKKDTPEHKMPEPKFTQQPDSPGFA